MNLTINQYLENPALGSSALKGVLKNAKKFNLERTGQLDPTTGEMQEGRIFHALLLEPEKVEDMIYLGVPLRDEIADIYKHMNSFDNIHVVDADSRRHGAFQKKKKEITENERVVTKSEWDLLQEHLANKDKIFILKDRLDTIKKWTDKIRILPHMNELLEKGEKEQTFFGEIDGVAVKCRIDLLFRRKENKVAIIDMKSMAGECTSEEFKTASGRNLYFMQESLYRWVLLQNDLEIEEYNFAAASKEDWSGAGYFCHDERSRACGDLWVEKAIEKYKYCMEKNLWLESDFNFQQIKFETVSEISIPAYITSRYPEMMG